MNQITQLYRQTLRFDDCIQAWGGTFLLLGLRLYVGWQFFKAGMVKVQDWNATLALFQDEYMVPLLPPELAAYAGAGGELLLPLLLFAGLLTRPAALALLAMNVMAVLSYPQLFMFDCPAALNDHYAWGVMLLVVAVFGGGRLSADAALARRLS
jgi:putative oxidoreductase